jgi:hypothetical protein
MHASMHPCILRGSVVEVHPGPRIKKAGPCIGYVEVDKGFTVLESGRALPLVVTLLV